MLNLTEPKEQERMLRLMTAQTLREASEVKTRLLEVVQFFSQHGSALSVSDLNRRFGQRIVALSGAALSESLAELVGEGLVGVERKHKKNWVFDAVLLRKESESLSDSPFETDVTRANILETWIKKAQDSDAD